MAPSRKLVGTIGLEAVMIVVSILLAFAIDAAWEGREERQREHDLLATLHADFERNRELLTQARSLHGSYRDAALDFLASSAPGEEVPVDARVADATLLGLVSWHTYDPAVGSLNSAIASGQLSLVSDDRLRVALAGWLDSVEDLNELEVVDRGHAQRFAEIAFDLVPFRSAVFRMGGAPEIERPSTAEPDYQTLLGSLHAENVAMNRVAEIGFIMSDMDRVEVEIDEILELLDASMR